MKQTTITKTYLYFDSDSNKKFKKFLIEKGLTHGEAADLLNVSSTYLSLVINGKRELTKRLQEQLTAIGFKL